MNKQTNRQTRNYNFIIVDSIVVPNVLKFLFTLFIIPLSNRLILLIWGSVPY